MAENTEKSERRGESKKYEGEARKTKNKKKKKIKLLYIEGFVSSKAQ